MMQCSFFRQIGEESPNKPIIWIDAGIHAREWIAPATALYIISRVTPWPQLLNPYHHSLFPCMTLLSHDHSFWKQGQVV